jgi:hypothetical protein
MREQNRALALAHDHLWRKRYNKRPNLVLAGAHGGPAWSARGEQFGRYEAAIGTGQAIFWFAP